MTKKIAGTQTVFLLDWGKGASIFAYSWQTLFILSGGTQLLHNDSETQLRWRACICMRLRYRMKRVCVCVCVCVAAQLCHWHWALDFSSACCLFSGETEWRHRNRLKQTCQVTFLRGTFTCKEHSCDELYPQDQMLKE